MKRYEIIAKYILRLGCHASIYVIVLVMHPLVQATPVHVLVGMLTSYTLAIMLTPMLNRINDWVFRHDLPSTAMIFMYGLLWLPLVVAEETGLSVPVLNIQMLAIIPIAVYHYGAVTELMGISKKSNTVLALYALSALAGATVGLLFEGRTEVLAVPAVFVVLTIVLNLSRGYGGIGAYPVKEEIQEKQQQKAQ